MGGKNLLAPLQDLELGARRREEGLLLEFKAYGSGEEADDLTAAQAFLYHKALDLTPSTLALHVRALRRHFIHCGRKDISDALDPPTVRRAVHDPDRIKDALSHPDDTVALLAHMGYGFGLGPLECAQLRLEDFPPWTGPMDPLAQRRQAHSFVLHGVPFPIPPKLVAASRALDEKSDSLQLLPHIAEGATYHKAKRALGAAGVTIDTLRRTAIRDLAQAGVDLRLIATVFRRNLRSVFDIWEQTPTAGHSSPNFYVEMWVDVSARLHREARSPTPGPWAHLLESSAAEPTYTPRRLKFEPHGRPMSAGADGDVDPSIS